MIKYFSIFAIGLIVLVVLLIAFNSVDTRTAQSTKLQSGNAVLSDVDNGYFQLKGMEKIVEESADSVGFNTEELKGLVYHNAWDEELVQYTLERYEDAIESIRSVNKYPGFKVPIPDEPFALPEYQYLVKLNRFVILKSLLLIQQGKYDKAIMALGDALQFSRRVKMDRNFYLISYMIGLVMEYEAVLNIHHLSNLPEISVDQLKALKRLLEAEPNYEDDQFTKVFWGEYQYSKNYFDEFLGLSFTERWQQYKNEEDWMAGASWLEEDEAFSLSREIYRLMVVAAPKFYMHKDRSLGHLADRYATYQIKAEAYCVDTPEEPYEYNWYQTPSWKDIVTPNSLGYSTADPQLNYSEYLIRRCFARAYFESVKAIIALQLYQRDTGELPSTLAQLPLQYLSEPPVDPFSGGILSYDKTNQWLISVGRNHIADVQNEDGLYFHYCYSDEYCSREPIFPVAGDLLTDERQWPDADDDSEKGAGEACVRNEEN